MNLACVHKYRFQRNYKEKAGDRREPMTHKKVYKGNTWEASVTNSFVIPG